MITEGGHRLIAAFRRLEAKLNEISAEIGSDGADAPIDLLFWNVAMKTSARNALHCRVTAVNRSAVNAEITLQLTATSSIVAVITTRSADDLQLAPGRHVVALVKSSFVMLARAGEAPRVSVANSLAGTVLKRHDDAVNSELVIDIGDGKTLISVITRHSAEALALQPKVPVIALFDAANVILAVD
jgi:molybdate transport system regulatory protein